MIKPTSVANHPVVNATYFPALSLSEDYTKKIYMYTKPYPIQRKIPLVIDATFSLFTVLFLLSGRDGGSLEKSGGLILAGNVLAFMGFVLSIE